MLPVSTSYTDNVLPILFTTSDFFFNAILFLQVNASNFKYADQLENIYDDQKLKSEVFWSCDFIKLPLDVLVKEIFT